MIYDLCVIGGGINGVGIARDAAGRGLKVLLLEARDLAQGTSSNSSKMIHGGLRYLEFYEFGLVRKSLAEREVMMRIAPQIVKPLRFCIPHREGIRPAWMVRIGLFIYDHLTRMNLLPKSSLISLSKHPAGHALKKRCGKGFLYSDCWVDDARLVVLNAMDAKLHGADIYTQCPVTKLSGSSGGWSIETPKRQFEAKMVVNATGPHVHRFLEKQNLTTAQTPRLRLVQGSHIVVPKLYDGDYSYLIQCPDKRVVFVWPYEQNFTLVGTTETVIEGNPDNAKITEQEKDYLLQVVNREFEKTVSRGDILWDYTGVRPLFDSGSESDTRKVTRDYRLILDDWNGSKIVNVFGGKITTYRPLAEETVDMLEPYFPQMGRPWSANVALPLIDFSFKPDEKTIRHFIHNEWALTIDDVLWRRTKWGLHFTSDQIKSISELFYKILAEELSHEKNSSH